VATLHAVPSPVNLPGIRHGFIKLEHFFLKVRFKPFFFLFSFLDDPLFWRLLFQFFVIYLFASMTRAQRLRLLLENKNRLFVRFLFFFVFYFSSFFVD